MAFPRLLIEVVGEVVSKYYSSVVEFESWALCTQPIWFIPLGSYAQRFDFGIPSANILASGLAFQGVLQVKKVLHTRK